MVEKENKEKSPNLDSQPMGVKTEESDTPQKEMLSLIGDCGNLLSDEITVAILEHIVETGGCTREDIVNLDSVVRESRSLIAELEQLGLIKTEGDIVLITERGTKFFEHLQKLEELLSLERR